MARFPHVLSTDAPSLHRPSRGRSLPSATVHGLGRVDVEDRSSKLQIQRLGPFLPGARTQNMEKKQFFLRKTQVFDGPCGAPGRSSRRFLDSDLRSVDLTPRVVVNSTSMMFSQGVYSFETVLEKPGA